ncbi:hypothetical protein CVV65_06140 [Kyrpidia spormannii]|uniref:Uncharacterized protein n=1 Tax=Kyrpidia spormannii TaxID=2055160 RepID=A0A2K8N703_9BACL|nr:hypothetical protein CVV65_06140 [Kyrpidia spormannii]
MLSKNDAMSESIRKMQKTEVFSGIRHILLGIYPTDSPIFWIHWSDFLESVHGPMGQGTKSMQKFSLPHVRGGLAPTVEKTRPTSLGHWPGRKVAKAACW